MKLGTIYGLWNNAHFGTLKSWNNTHSGTLHILNKTTIGTIENLEQIILRNIAQHGTIHTLVQYTSWNYI